MNHQCHWGQIVQHGFEKTVITTSKQKNEKAS